MLTNVFVWLLIYKGQSHSTAYPYYMHVIPLSHVSMNIMKNRLMENIKNDKDFITPEI